MSNHNFKSLIKNLFINKRKLKQDELKKVNGAGEPEEFDWKPKGYETPVKEGPKEGEWAYGSLDPNNNPKNK